MALMKFKRSAVPSKVPSTADLALGELAINTYDGKLFLKKDDGTQSVVEIGAGGGGGSGTVTSVSGTGTVSGLTLTGSITTSGSLTLGGTLALTSTNITDGLGFTPYNATNPDGFTSNTGTVTSINLTAGTGVSVSGGPITSSGAITVTNTAPDQVVSLTGAGATTVTGTYPNFTITTTAGGSGTVTSVAASGGTTGLTFTGSPITTAGTLTLGGTLAVANGGTGATTLTSGYVLKGNGTSAVSASVLYDDGTNIGIGTTSPSALFHISQNGGGDIGALVSQTNGGNGTTARYRATHGSGAAFNLQAGNGHVDLNVTSNHHLTFGTNDTERFRIGASGQFGIGGATYGSAGQVLTSGGASAAPTWTTPTTGTVTSVGGTGTVNGITLTGTVTSSGSLTLGGTLSGVNLASQVTGTLPVANGGTGATSLTSGYLVKGNGTSAASASVVYDNGTNVGIGTASPSEKLSVAGNIAVGFDSASANTVLKSFTTGHAVANRGATIAFGMYDSTFAGMKLLNEAAANASFNRQYITFDTHEGAFSSGERMRIDGYGNVGIGATNPSSFTPSTLVVQAATTAGITISDSTGGGTASIAFSATSAFQNRAKINCTMSTQSLEFSTAGAERMRIDSSGNVVVGSTTAIGNFSVVTPNGGDTRRLAIGHQSGYPSLFSRDSDGTTVTSGFWDAQQQIFTNAGTERMRIDSAGNVGIGVVPSAWSAFKALQVNHGALSSTAVGNHNVSLSANAYFDGSNWRYIGSSFATEFRQNGGAFQWYQAPSGTAGNAISFTQAMTLDASGNLGVGVATIANTRLYVRTAAITDTAYYADNGANSGFKVKFASSTTSILNDFGAALVLGTNDTERMRINSSGDIGIGTSAPNSKLHVSFSPPGSIPALGSGVGGVAIGPASSYGTLLGTISDGTGYIQQQRFDAGTAVYPLALQPNGGNVGIGTNGTSGRLSVKSATGTVGFNAGTSSSPERGNLWYDTDNSGWSFNIGKLVGSTFSPQMTFQDNGNVSIGTTSALGGRVTILGSAAGAGFLGFDTDATRVDIQSYNKPLAINRQGNNTLLNEGGGNVGIGTVNPGWKLEVYSGLADKLRLFNTVGLGNTIDFLDQNWQSQIVGYSGELRFNTGGTTERMRIDGSGNVSIGTSAALNKLTVSSAGDNGILLDVPISAAVYAEVRARYQGQNNCQSAIRFYNPNNGFGGALSVWTQPESGGAAMIERMRVTETGNVGIGRGDPPAALSILRNSSTASVAASSSIVLTNKNTDINGTIAGGIFVDTYRDVANPHYSGGIWFTRNQIASNFSSSSDIVFGATGSNSSNALPAELMRISAGGSVGIGTVAPSAKLDVVGQAMFQGTTLSTYRGVNIGALNINNNSNDGTVDFTQGLVFTANSNDTGAWPHAGIVATGSTGFRGNLVFGTDDDGTKTNAITERMRITSAGDVLVGTTSASSLGTQTKFRTSGNGGAAGASIGSVSGAGTGAVDTLIPINQSSFGGTALLLASRNTSDGVNTASAVYLVTFYFDGNNAPTKTLIAGTDFVTFGVSGSQTLTLTNAGDGNVTYAWFGNK